MTVGSLNQKSQKKSFGTIGAHATVKVAQAAPVPPSKPWDSDVFAPESIKPATKLPVVQKPKQKDNRRKSTINRAADRQLGVLEDEGY